MSCLLTHLHSSNQVHANPSQVPNSTNRIFSCLCVQVLAFAEEAIAWCLLRQKAKHDAALQAVDALRGSTASSDPTATAADSSSSADPATVSSSSSSTAQEKSRSAAQARKIAELETQAQGEAFKLERIHTAGTKLAALKADSSSGGSSSDTAPVLSIAGDFMADLLDQRLGSSVVEPSIYRAHAAKFEVSVSHQAVDHRNDLNFHTQNNAFGLVLLNSLLHCTSGSTWPHLSSHDLFNFQAVLITSAGPANSPSQSQMNRKGWGDA